MTRRVHIVGRKNSGKTTLIEELLRELTARRGLRVGTIKHTHHRHELDTPGKDSHRHREAGGGPIVILAPGMTALFQPQPEPRSSEARLEEALGHFVACDLVLVEGALHCPGRKVEVWRPETRTELLAREHAGIDAVVSRRAPPNYDGPWWPRQDLAGLAERIMDLAE